MKPAHPSVMTPQPLSCVMHHILLPSSSEHGCHHASWKAPPEASHKLRDTRQKREGKAAVLLDASSTSQTPEGVILIYICWCHLFFHPLPSFSSSSSSYARLIHYGAEKKWAGGMSRAVGVRAVCASPFSQYIIDAVFLLLEHLCCIMHIKFMESIIVYQPWEAWEHFSPYLNLLQNIYETLSAWVFFVSVQHGLLFFS